MPNRLAALSYHAAQSRQAPLAARLLGAADTARTTTGITLLPQFALRLPAVDELAAVALGALKFHAEVTVGRHLTRDAAIRLALGEPASADTTARDSSTRGPLSARQGKSPGS